MKDITFVYQLDNGKEIEMKMIDNPYGIEDCQEGKIVHLFLKNLEEYQGIFRGMDNDNIMLKSLQGVSTIGININFVKQFLIEQ